MAGEMDTISRWSRRCAWVLAILASGCLASTPPSAGAGDASAPPDTMPEVAARDASAPPDTTPDARAASDAGVCPHTGSESGGSGNSPLRFDGLYRYLERDSYDMLRFYADGTVLEVATTSDAKPSDLAPWFNKDHAADMQKGTYCLDRSAVAFTVTGPNGSVEYAGQVAGDALTLDSHSFITGYRRTGVTYSFSAVSFVK
jgi:hypothetical protein